MQRPGLVVGLLFSTGIWLADAWWRGSSKNAWLKSYWLSGDGVINGLILLETLLLVSGIFLMIRYRNFRRGDGRGDGVRITEPLLLAIIILGAGFGRYALWRVNSCRAVAWAPTGWVELKGKVVKIADSGPTREAWVIRVDPPLTAAPARNKGYLIQVIQRKGMLSRGSSLVRIEVGGFSPGDVVLVKGVLERPQAKGNPGEFDYRMYLLRQGIVGTIYLSPERPGEIRKLGQEQPVPFPGFFQKVPDFLRAGFQKVYRATLPEPAASLLSGIILGGGSDLPRELQQAFRISGVYHILAVSGSNVALIALTFFQLLQTLGISRFFNGFGSIMVVLLYVLMTGSPASAVRAGVMTSIFLIGLAYYRKPDGLNSLGVAVLVLLGINPANLFDPGFQLSVLATWGILVFSRPLQGFLEQFPVRFSAPAGWGSYGTGLEGFVQRSFKWASYALSVTLAAQIAVAPILAYYFNYVSIVALVANLFVVPLVDYLLVSGFIAGVIGIVYLPVASLINVLNRLALDFMIKGVAWLSVWPLASLQVLTPSYLEIIAYYGTLLWAFNYFDSFWRGRSDGESASLSPDSAGWLPPPIRQFLPGRENGTDSISVRLERLRNL